MSIVTLKKKTQAKYHNASVGHAQFSINGIYRLQGYVGQTSLSRCLPKTLKRGNDSRGFGFDSFKNTPGVLPQDIWTTEDSKTVKSSVLSNKGMIENQTLWVRRPQPFSSWKPDLNQQNNTSGAFTRHKKKNSIIEYNNNIVPVIQSDKCNKCLNITNNDISKTPQSTYIENLCSTTTCTPFPRIFSNSMNIPLPGN